MNPCMRTSHQVGTQCQIRVDTDKAGFMAAERHEEALPDRIGGGQFAYGLQPTGNTAATLARTLPPSAARRTYDKWLKAWISACNARRHVKGLCCFALDTNDQIRLSALLHLCFEPLALGTRHLEHRRA